MRAPRSLSAHEYDLTLGHDGRNERYDVLRIETSHQLSHRQHVECHRVQLGVDQAPVVLRQVRSMPNRADAARVLTPRATPPGGGGGIGIGRRSVVLGRRRRASGVLMRGMRVVFVRVSVRVRGGL